MPKKKTELEKRNVLRLSNEESNQLTRECLETALLYLMTDKELDKITITELVAKAGVSRTAFYSNYTSKEDILSNILSDALDEMSELALDVLSKGSVTELCISLFKWMETQRESISVLLKANMYELLFFEIEKKLRKFFPHGDTQTSYLLTAWCGAFYRIVIRWAKEGMPSSFDEPVAACRIITETVMEQLQEKYPDFPEEH